MWRRSGAKLNFPQRCVSRNKMETEPRCHKSKTAHGDQTGRFRLKTAVVLEYVKPEKMVSGPVLSSDWECCDGGGGGGDVGRKRDYGASQVGLHPMEGNDVCCFACMVRKYRIRPGTGNRCPQLATIVCWVRVSSTDNNIQDPCMSPLLMVQMRRLGC